MDTEVGGAAALEFRIVEIADVLELLHRFAYGMILRIDVRGEVEAIPHALH
ncbi:hypothetical protein D3C76_1712870 [compost metagenome]